MGKKRVFEIAKELGYQNRDLIEKLQKLGIEVKSHSSTVDEDEVRRALRKAEDERRAKTQESRVSRGVIRRRPIEEAGMAQSTGMGGVVVRTEARSESRAPVGAGIVVRRRASEESSGPTTDVAETKRPFAAETEAKLDGTAVAREPEAEPQTEDLWVEELTEDLSPAASHAPIEALAPAAPVEIEAKSDQAEEAPEHPAPVVEALIPDLEEKGQAGEEPVVAKPHAEEPAEVEAREARETEGKKERREARTARPDRKREETFDEDDEKPELDIEDLGISVSDFSVASFDRPMEAKATRVAPPPPSTIVATQKKEEEPQTKIVRTIDPSVLKARLSASKRPEPPKEWGKSPEQEVAASPLTELVVRTDASGKRKELVDVRKEAARGKAGKAGQRRREEMSAKDLLEHKRGQVYYPTPGRKRIKN